MKIYTAWLRTAPYPPTYKHVADITAPSPEAAWRIAAETARKGQRIIITAEGNQKPPSLAAGLCEGVVT